MKKRLLSLSMLFLFISACAAASPVLTEKSKGSKPKWITAPPQDKDYFYFIGTKSKAASYEAGVKGALNAAMSQVLMTIGFSFVVQTEITTRIEGDKDLSTFIDKTKETGQVNLKEQRIQETYFEKYRDFKTVIENNLKKKVEEVYYDVYLLLKYSKKEIKDEQKRKEQQDKENLRLADQLNAEASGLISSGQVMDAYNKYASILKILSSQAGIPLFNKVLSTLKDIAQNVVLSETKVADKKTIGIAAFFQTSSSKSAVQKLNVSSEITLGNGEIDRIVLTDSAGTGRCKIQKMSFDGGLAKVRFSLPADQFILPIMDTAINEEDKTSIEQTVKSKNLTITLKSSDYSTTKVTVIVWNKNGERNKEVESLITEALTGAGINVVIPSSLTADLNYKNFDNPDFYQTLSAEGINVAVMGQSDAIDNGRVYNFQSVTGTIDTRIVDIKQRQVLTTVSKSKTMPALTFEQARLNCFKELSKIMTPAIVSTVSAE